jgi:alanyl-tRNA synthetase
MTIQKTTEIRRAFLEYFARNNHEIVNSASLVPHNDDSLMFTNAGMVQFKNYFTGIEQPKFKRAVSAQKCVRAGGKHNDLENVGYTARHHTFFEMLGNFSFGDYFKEEAIFYAWEFLTKELSLPKEKLLFTVYHEDQESFDLWKKVAGVSDNKIIKIATNDNFWAMGDTGPCGPCSEIFYDHGSSVAGGLPGSENEGDRFVEIWNLVFMQFNQLANGERVNLPNTAIDTGMGLERIAAILQGKHNNFEIDIFSNLINHSQKITHNNNPKLLTSHRVIVDHLRSIVFLIADGVLPSNEGRGYVLRRIMRRAMRHVHQLGYKNPLLNKLFTKLLEEMGGHYFELHNAKELILETLILEEEKFGKTLDKGVKILQDEILQYQSQDYLSGGVAFKLYDTYGFPVDLTADIIKEFNLKINYQEFDKLMLEQKSRGKENWSGSGKSSATEFWFKLNQKNSDIKFTGYQDIVSQAKILAIINVNNVELNIADNKDQEYLIITDQTPFYAESGGQVGDIGIISAKNGKFEVTNTKKRAKNLIIHFGRLLEGSLSCADIVSLEINQIYRNKVKANHSATHLLHKILKNRLGNHVSQRGSYVADKMLRFDFTHNKAVTKEQIIKIEQEVNQIICKNHMVKTNIMSIDEAKKSGAEALFGEKYDDKVRVVTMGEDSLSKELCGGTHVNRVGDIGSFKIISEGSIASGVRRIEAITGEEVLLYMQKQQNILSQIESLLKSPANELLDNVTNLLNSKKTLLKELSYLKQKLNSNIEEGDLLNVTNDRQIMLKIFNDIEAKELREIALNFKQRYLSSKLPIMVLLARVKHKISIITLVDNSFVSKVSAIELVKEVVLLTGGKGGGGKDNFAQGGGVSLERLNELKKYLNKII